jgi:uncharacterized membrane protein (DUF4010 family)
VEPYDSFFSLGIALSAGLLIGIEREQSRTPEPERGSFVGGIRTYPLFALLGALSSLIRGVLSPWLPVLAFLTLAALVSISYANDVRTNRDRSLTTEVSSLVTFLLGALATSSDFAEPVAERVMLVAALSVVVTFLLSSKPRLRAFVERVSENDLYATVKFLIIAVLVLPLLPNRTVDPLGVVNPFEVGGLVVILASVNFAGYVASRTLGARRGLAIAALVGGLVSSTAVTVSLSERVRRESRLTPLAASAIVIASTVMLGRVLALVAVVDPSLVPPLAPSIASMAVVGVVASVILYRKATDGPGLAPGEVLLSNPFELGTAVRFGLVFAVVLVLSKAAEKYVGPSAIYATTAVAATTDVDAITLSTAHLTREGLAPSVGVTAILVGTVSNTLTKGVLSRALADRALAKPVGLAFASMLLAAGLAVVAMQVMT